MKIRLALPLLLSLALLAFMARVSGLRGSEAEDSVTDAAYFEEERRALATPTPAPKPTPGGQDAQGWENILLLGTDVRDSAASYGNSDSMIVLSVNYATHEAKLTSFMRDLWVKIPGVKGENKLNAACLHGGPKLTVRTLNQYFDLNLEHYVMVNLSCMAEVIDQLGGLRLDVTEAERAALNKGLFDLSSRSGMEELEKSGAQVQLNGNQAVAFARIRRIDSDYRRTERQRAVLTAIARKLQQKGPMAVIAMVMGFMRYVKTDLDLPQLLALADLGTRVDLNQVAQYRVPAENTYKDGMFDGVWCIRADLERNRKLLRRFIYG